MTGPLHRRAAPQVARKAHGPRYWMYDQRLRPTMLAWFADAPLTDDQIVAMREYLKAWIMAPGWLADAVEDLKAQVDGLDSRAKIERWLIDALQVGVDPL